MAVKEKKPILIQDVDIDFWNNFAGEAKKRGLKIPEAFTEAGMFWLEHRELFAKVGK